MNTLGLYFRIRLGVGLGCTGVFSFLLPAVVGLLAVHFATLTLVTIPMDTVGDEPTGFPLGQNANALVLTGLDITDGILHSPPLSPVGTWVPMPLKFWVVCIKTIATTITLYLFSTFSG